MLMIVLSLRWKGQQILLFYSVSLLGVVINSYSVNVHTEKISLGL